MAVTGKSGRQLAPLVGGTYENDFRCLVKAVTAGHPEVRTIFEMGGENAKVVRLGTAGGGGALTIGTTIPTATARREPVRSSTSRPTA